MYQVQAGTSARLDVIPGTVIRIICQCVAPGPGTVFFMTRKR